MDYWILAAPALVIVLLLILEVLPEFNRWHGGLIRLPWKGGRPMINDLNVLGVRGTVSHTVTFSNGVTRFVVYNRFHKREYDYQPGELTMVNAVDHAEYYAGSIGKLFNDKYAKIYEQYKALERKNQILIEHQEDLIRDQDARIEQGIQHGINVIQAKQKVKQVRLMRQTHIRVYGRVINAGLFFASFEFLFWAFNDIPFDIIGLFLRGHTDVAFATMRMGLFGLIVSLIFVSLSAFLLSQCFLQLILAISEVLADAQ